MLRKYLLAALLVALPAFAGDNPLRLGPPSAPIAQVGHEQIFSLTYDGADFGGALVSIADPSTFLKTCLFRFESFTRSLTLIDVALGSVQSGPVAVFGSLDNSQCSINLGNSSLVFGQNDFGLFFVLHVAVTFHDGGARLVNARALPFYGYLGPWRQIGTVLVLPTAP